MNRTRVTRLASLLTAMVFSIPGLVAVSVVATPEKATAFKQDDHEANSEKISR